MIVLGAGFDTLFFYLKKLALDEQLAAFVELALPQVVAKKLYFYRRRPALTAQFPGAVIPQPPTGFTTPTASTTMLLPFPSDGGTGTSTGTGTGQGQGAACGTSSSTSSGAAPGVSGVPSGAAHPTTLGVSTTNLLGQSPPKDNLVALLTARTRNSMAVTGQMMPPPSPTHSSFTAWCVPLLPTLV